METLCGLFGKSKQAYYKHKRKYFSELEIEREVLSIVATYRAEMPTDVESPETDSASAIKVVQNDQVLILRGDKTYTVQGQEVR